MSRGAVARVEAALAALGVPARVVEFLESTRTAAEAAAAIGTSVAQIVKSLVFVVGDEPILVLASGANRVDTAKLAARLGRAVRRASAEEARAATGYVIGGTPPVGHARPLRTFLDPDLLRFDEVWAAAGAPNAVFPIAPETLQRVTGAEVLDLRAEPSGA